MYESIESRLAAGKPVVLDGGTGTEIQRAGVPMDSEVWCAAANLTHGEAVRGVHEAYIRAGAAVITANTYASSPLCFAQLGREAEIERIDRTAVALARDAVARAADRPIAIAGSCSVMPAVAPGTDRVPPRQWNAGDIVPLYQRKVEVLAEAGCDLIIVEMMRDLEVSLWATEAAVATGLPVWVGVTAERDDAGRLVSFANHRWTLEELVSGLMGTGAQLAAIMHHELSTTDDALAAIRAQWGGPMGAYPEAGHFEMPTWVFRDTSPAEFAAAAVRWRDAGAGVIGGCCGITPAHISALAGALQPVDGES